MKVTLSIFYLLFSVQLAFSQEDPVKQFVNSIKSHTDTWKLNAYLLQHDLIPLDKEDTTTHFRAGEVKVDVFRKNLFGDAQNEVVLQLREGESRAVSIFYYEQNQLKKVPGHIVHYPIQSDYGGYGEQRFVFDFVNVFAENEFIIAGERYSEYVRTGVTHITLYRVKKEGIDPLYSFDKNSSTYSGVGMYEHSSSCTYSFVLENSYPKVLVKKVEFYNMSRDTKDISVKIEQGNYTERISFTTQQPAVQKIQGKTYHSYFVTRAQDLQWINKNATCDSFTTIYLEEDFFIYFLSPEEEVPELEEVFVGHEETRALVCCRAWMANGKLFIQSKADATGKSVTRSYQTKLPVSSILKKEIDAARLYYIRRKLNDATGKLVYASRDSVVLKNEALDVFQFSDSTLFYEPYKGKDHLVRLSITSEEYNSASIPLSRLAPYIKPEIVVELERCCKE